MLEEFQLKFAQLDKETHPADGDSFKKDLSKKLDKGEREIFCTFAVKALHLCEQHRLDAQPAMVVLCTGVRTPKQNDWNEHVQAVKFLHCAMDDVLTLSMGNVMVSES